MRSGSQDEGHPGYVGPDVRYDCGLCIESHAKRNDFPVLDDEHVLAWNVYFTLADQQRVAGMGAILGLDVTAIEPVLRLMQIPAWRWPGLFERLMAIDHAAAKERERERRARELAERMKGHA